MAERSKTFCPLPFMHSHASVSGRWKPCCNSTDVQDEKNYFNKDGHTHISWFKSQRMDQLRKNLLNGVQDPVCNICWRSEKISGESLRTNYLQNKRFQNFQNSDDIINKPDIKYLDLKLSNECNLRCRMCDYTNSHKILEDILAIEQDKSLVMPSNYGRSPKHERHINSKGIKQMPDHVFDEIINDILPNLELLKVTGGEPLVQKQVLKLFDVCVEKGYAKNINLSITTNATKFTATFLEKIKNFKEVKFNISCDGYETVYDYIRYPFNWTKFVERINDVNQAKVSYSIATVPQMYNIENISKLQKWNDDVQIDKDNKVFLNTFLNPEYIYNSLKFVPKNILEKAFHEIDKNDNSTILVKYLEKLIRDDYQPSDYENKQIVDSVKSLDTVRNQDFRNYLEPMTSEWLEGLFKQYA